MEKGNNFLSLSRIAEMMMICAHISDFIYRTRTPNRSGVRTGGKGRWFNWEGRKMADTRTEPLRNTDQSRRMAQMEPELIQRASEQMNWPSPELL